MATFSPQSTSSQIFSQQGTLTGSTFLSRSHWITGNGLWYENRHCFCQCHYYFMPIHDSVSCHFLFCTLYCSCKMYTFPQHYFCLKKISILQYTQLLTNSDFLREEPLVSFQKFPEHIWKNTFLQEWQHFYKIYWNNTPLPGHLDHVLLVTVKLPSVKKKV